MDSTYFIFEECDGTMPMNLPSEVLNIHNFIFTIEKIELEEHSNDPLHIIMNWEYELSHAKHMRKLELKDVKMDAKPPKVIEFGHEKHDQLIKEHKFKNFANTMTQSFEGNNKLNLTAEIKDVN